MKRKMSLHHEPARREDLDAVIAPDLDAAPGAVRITVRAAEPSADPAAFRTVAWLARFLAGLGHRVDGFERDGRGALIPLSIPRADPPALPRRFEVVREFAPPANPKWFGWFAAFWRKGQPKTAARLSPAERAELMARISALKSTAAGAPLRPRVVPRNADRSPAAREDFACRALAWCDPGKDFVAGDLVNRFAYLTVSGILDRLTDAAGTRLESSKHGTVALTFRWTLDGRVWRFVKLAAPVPAPGAGTITPFPPAA